MTFMKAKEIYQKYLKSEYQRRRQRNAAYSLRAYARDLQIPSSKLSQYLRGECGVSGKKAAQLAQRLRLGPVEAELFVCAAETAHSRHAITRETAGNRLQSLLSGTFSEINMEKFSLIRDWYHLAILELTEIEQFENNVAWIAKALRITEAQVSEAVERLERLGLLVCGPQKWVQTQGDFETPPDFSSRAVRDYHHQMIELVDSRFEDVPLDQREMGSVLMGLDQEIVPELKSLIRTFQKDAAALAERSSRKGCLYALNIQFVPLFEGHP
jgi:uncharacterized protein (TIGR02147 family)